MKRRNKGFTLIELLGVLVLLAVISIIVFPLVDSSIKQSKEKAYQTTVNSILESAQNYRVVNNLKEDGQLNLSLLVQEGFLTNDDIIDPRTKQSLSGCVFYSWDEESSQYLFNYSPECTIN